MANISAIKLPDNTTYDIKDSISGYATEDQLATKANLVIAYVDPNISDNTSTTLYKDIWCEEAYTYNDIWYNDKVRETDDYYYRLMFIGFTNGDGDADYHLYVVSFKNWSFTLYQVDGLSSFYAYIWTAGWSGTAVFTYHALGNTISYNDLSNKPTIPTKTSDLTNDSGFITGMTILSYGTSTWNDFLTAYNANKVVYCRASSNSNPASGSQTRLAFMAYVNNATSPTSVEFQYYRSVSTHSDSQQGDQVYVYTLTSAGTWSVTVREAYSKIGVGGDLSKSYSNGTLTLSATIPTYSRQTPSSGGTTLSLVNTGDMYAWNNKTDTFTATYGTTTFDEIKTAYDANERVVVHYTLYGADICLSLAGLVDSRTDPDFPFAEAIFAVNIDAELCVCGVRVGEDSENTGQLVEAWYYKSVKLQEAENITQAEYDALTPAQKSDGTIYFIYDGTPTPSPTPVSSLQNLVDGSATASVRGVGTAGESGSYTMGTYAFAEGHNTKAKGTSSHAEGYQVIASGPYSHAEGNNTEAVGDMSHAEGSSTIASGDGSHAEGAITTASGNYASHAEGYDTTASGWATHSQNLGTIAQRKSQTALGEYNVADTTGTTASRGDYVVIVGNGTADNDRSNALTVDWSGNVDIASGAHYKINGSNLSASDVGAQATLVSGTNIKTINNQSLLGSGNIPISVSGTPIPTADTVAEFDSSACMNSSDMSSADVASFVASLNISAPSTLIDVFYPVGSYYETSNTSFNPNIAWSGTWVLETEGQVHVSAGANYIVNGAPTNTSDGGESTHVLSLEEMPSHNHNSKSISGTLNAYTWGDGGSSGIVSKKTDTKNQKATTGNQIGWVTYTIDATHTHDTQGSGTAHNNMQPYIVVNRWHRTA